MKFRGSKGERIFDQTEYFMFFAAAAVIYHPQGEHDAGESEKSKLKDRLLIRLKFNSNIYVLRNVNVFLHGFVSW